MAVTPGPYTVEQQDLDVGGWLVASPHAEHGLHGKPLWVAEYCTEEDAAFIAAACNAFHNAAQLLGNHIDKVDPLLLARRWEDGGKIAAAHLSPE